MKLFLFFFILSIRVFSVSLEENELYKNYIFLYGANGDDMFYKHQEPLKHNITALKRQQELAAQVKKLAKKDPAHKEEFLITAVEIIKYWASQ